MGRKKGRALFSLYKQSVNLIEKRCKKYNG